ncbi:hypothetical protein A0W34_30505 (plasmid) [Rhodococcus sp. BH4]|nr:hypothetical protein A0W34_30505 [Rhodococcus sp. BH4]
MHTLMCSDRSVNRRSRPDLAAEPIGGTIIGSCETSNHDKGSEIRDKGSEIRDIGSETAPKLLFAAYMATNWLWQIG